MLRTEERILRLRASALHALKPNEMVHLDFLYKRRAADREGKHVLVIEDDFSFYTWLHACANADNDAATWAVPK